MKNKFLNAMLFLVVAIFTIGLRNVYAEFDSIGAESKLQTYTRSISNESGVLAVYIINEKAYSLNNGYTRKHTGKVPIISFYTNVQKMQKKKYNLQNYNENLIFTFRMRKGGDTIDLYQPDNRTESEKARGVQTVGGNDVPIFYDEMQTSKQPENNSLNGNAICPETFSPSPFRGTTGRVAFMNEWNTPVTVVLYHPDSLSIYNRYTVASGQNNILGGNSIVIGDSWGVCFENKPSGISGVVNNVGDVSDYMPNHQGGALFMIQNPRTR
jgi:hypothetical protein